MTSKILSKRPQHMKSATVGNTVTVAIVFRNAARTITKCLESIHNQYDDIVAMNDFSTDYGADIFADRKIAVMPNYSIKKTVGDLRHELAEAVNTEFIYFQDADDKRLPNTVRWHINEMNEQGLDVLISPYQLTDGTVRTLQEDVISDIALRNFQTSAIYFRRKSLLELDPISDYGWEYRIIYSAFKEGLKIGYSRFVSQIWSGAGIIGVRNSKEQKYSLLRLFNKIKNEDKLTADQYNLICQAIVTYNGKESKL